MKKLLFLLLGAAVAMTATANPILGTKDAKHAAKVMPKTAMARQMKAKADVPNVMFGVDMPKMKDGNQQMNLKKWFKAPNRENSESDVITEQPEGELRTYSRAGACTYVTNSYSSVYAEQEGTTSIVFAPDGETVYIQNPVSEFAVGSWAKGTISGDKITLPLGQPLAWSSNYNTSLMLAWGTASEDYFYRNTSVTEATYTISGNTISLDNSSADLTESTITGLAVIWEDDQSWQGYIDGETVYTLAEDVEVPTVLTDQDVLALDGTLKYYVRTGGSVIYNGEGLDIMDQYGYAYIFFANDGQTVYMRNPVYGISVSGGSWVKGTLNGDKITVPTGQYLYWSTSYNYGLMTSWGSLTVEQATDSTVNLDFVPNDAITEMTYTISGNTVTMDNTPGDSESEIIGLGAIWNDDLSWQGFFDWSTVYNLLPDPAVAAVPADPEAIQWYDSNAEDGNSYFAFNLPLFDVDGNTLYPEYISYSIYTDDDEIFTFDTQTYAADSLQSDLTEIPVDVWGGGYDFSNNVVYFYRTNAEGFTPLFDRRIGIQVHYTVDGVKNSSNIVYLEVVEPTPNVYILGEVNDKSWVPNDGVMMAYDEENKVYTATVTLDGRGESGENYFSFTTELAENDDDGAWAYIKQFRFGAVTDENNSDFWYDDMYDGQTLSLAYGGDKDPAAFRVMAGEYELTLSLENMTLIIHKVSGPEPEVLRGDVNRDGFVTIGDVTDLIDHLLSGNLEEAEHFSPDNSDTNLDETISIGDVTTLIDYLLSGAWPE